MNQVDYFNMSNAQCGPFGMLQMRNIGMGALGQSMQDVNASTETAYPVKNGNSMNKKLEAAKKWLKDRK